MKKIIKNGKTFNQGAPPLLQREGTGVSFFLNNFSSLLLKKDYFSKKTEYFLLSAIVIIILCIRLYNIQSPSLDRTAWKEIDYIDISKNYVSNGFDFIEPTIQWPAEPPRVTAMECPIVPYFSSLLYPVFGFNAYTVRFITLLASLLLIIVVFKLVKFNIGQVSAIFAAFFAGFMPLQSPFNGLLYSEPTMILFSATAVYYFSKWIVTGKSWHYVAACVGFSVAVLLKLEPLYLLLVFFGLFFYKYRFLVKQYWKMVLFTVLAIVLPALWYSYAYYLTLHSIDVFGIYKGHDKMQTFTMLSDLSWWKGIVNNVINLSGGKLSILFVFAGFIVLIFIRSGLVIFLYLLSILCYFVIVAEGVQDGPYRALTIVPAIAAFASVGVLGAGVFMYHLWKRFSHNDSLKFGVFNTSIITGASIIILLSGMRLDTVLRNDTISPSHPEWSFAQQIKSLVAPGSRIITAGTYSIHKGGNDLSPVLYYYTGFRGWTLQNGDWNMETLNKYRNKGAAFMAVCEIDREEGLRNFVNELKKHYKTLIYDEKNQWILFSLTSTN